MAALGGGCWEQLVDIRLFSPAMSLHLMCNVHGLYFRAAGGDL